MTLSPLQMFTVPDGVTTAVGNGFTFTCIELEAALLPQLLVTASVKLPAAVVVKVGDVAPEISIPFFFHWYDTMFGETVEVNKTDPPLQNVVAEAAAICALAGGHALLTVKLP